MAQPDDIFKQLTGPDRIVFKISYKDREVPVSVYRGEYFSLMSLISDKFQVQNFGLCSGMVAAPASCAFVKRTGLKEQR